MPTQVVVVVVVVCCCYVLCVVVVCLLLLLFGVVCCCCCCVLCVVVVRSWPDRRLFPFWWLQLCTKLSIVFTGENSSTKSTRTPGAHGIALLDPTFSAGDCRGGTTEGTC